MLTYQEGDLFAGVQKSADAGKTAMIIHVCNDIGAWGSGFVVPLANHFPQSERAYREWHSKQTHNNVPFELGKTQFVDVSENVIVANMIGQHSIGMADGPPVRYAAISSALQLVNDYCNTLEDVEIHAPKFGAGLAGGNWFIIETLLKEILANQQVTVYELTKEEILERKAVSYLQNNKEKIVSLLD